MALSASRRCGNALEQQPRVACRTKLFQLTPVFFTVLPRDWFRARLAISSSVKRSIMITRRMKPPSRGANS
jgi:hypothetical protein